MLVVRGMDGASASKMGFIIGGAIGIGRLFLVTGVASLQALVIALVVGAIVGAIGAIVIAMIFNFACTMTGGLLFEIEVHRLEMPVQQTAQQPSSVTQDSSDPLPNRQYNHRAGNSYIDKLKQYPPLPPVGN